MLQLADGSAAVHIPNDDQLTVRVECRGALSLTVALARDDADHVRELGRTVIGEHEPERTLALAVTELLIAAGFTGAAVLSPRSSTLPSAPLGRASLPTSMVLAPSGVAVLGGACATSIQPC